MVAAYILFQVPYDSNINESYAPFGWRKLGVCCWTYFNAVDGNTYDGEVEYINTYQYMTQAKYANPNGFRYNIFGQNNALVTFQPTVQNSCPDVSINSKPYNVTTGTNMPYVPA
jgi:hypothetical protein